MDAMKTSLRLLLVLLAVLGVGSLLALPAAGAEARDRCDRAEQALSKAKSWTELRQWSSEYGEDCDDGHLAERVSEIVSISLAERWQDLPKLERQIKKAPRFREFVLRHIDSTAAIGDLEEVVENARKWCPVGLDSLCGAIGGEAAKALEEARHAEWRTLHSGGA